jgi:rod shape-determining protein MreB
LAVGKDAKDMIGRTPDTLRVYRPLREGVIADYRVTQAMLKYFVDKTLGYFKFLKPEMLVGVPAGITSTESRAVIEAGTVAGAKAVYLAKEPILVAIGAGIPISSCSGHMIVDIGGGTSEVAVISLGGIVAYQSLRIGGDEMDEAIIYYLKKENNLLVGESTAEKIKMEIGSAFPLENEEKMEVNGRDLVTGLPKTIIITSQQVRAALEKTLSDIINAIVEVLDETPPELASDIMKRGIVLSGGGALLKGLTERISRETHCPVYLAPDPLASVALGAGRCVEDFSSLQRYLRYSKH